MSFQADLSGCDVMLLCLIRTNDIVLRRQDGWMLDTFHRQYVLYCTNAHEDDGDGDGDGRPDMIHEVRCAVDRLSVCLDGVRAPS